MSICSARRTRGVLLIDRGKIVVLSSKDERSFENGSVCMYIRRSLYVRHSSSL